MPNRQIGDIRCHSSSCDHTVPVLNTYRSSTLPPMTSASANDDHAVTRPAASMNVSMRPASFSAPVTSAFQDFAVVDGLGVGGPCFELRHVGHIGLMHLLGHRVLGDRFFENFRVRATQCVDDGIGKRLRGHPLVLDEVFHCLGVVLLTPSLADHVA